MMDSAHVLGVRCDDALHTPRGKDRRVSDLHRVGGWLLMREYPQRGAVDLVIVGTGGWRRHASVPATTSGRSSVRTARIDAVVVAVFREINRLTSRSISPLARRRRCLQDHSRPRTSP